MRLAAISAVCALACAATVLAPKADARPIRVDSGTWTSCNSNGPPANYSIGITGYTTQACMTPDAGTPDNLDATAPYNVDPTSSVLYDLVAGDGTIVAQLGIYTLAGSASPNFEVQFNYTGFDSTTDKAFCAVPSTAPDFKLGGTYTFTAPLTDVCDATYTNDFLFTGTSLYGYVDDLGDVDVGACPPGWTCPAAVASAPEPSTMAIMLGSALMGFAALRRRRWLNRR